MNFDWTIVLYKEADFKIIITIKTIKLIRKMSEQFNNMDTMEDLALSLGSSNMAAVASLLLSISAGTLVAVDASQLESLGTRVALLEAQNLQQGASIDQLEGQQVVDAGYYTNESRFNIAKNYNSHECIYDFYVEAGHTFDFVGNWSSFVPYTGLKLL